MFHAVKRGHDIELLGNISDSIRDDISRQDPNAVLFVNDERRISHMTIDWICEVVDKQHVHSQCRAPNGEQSNAAADVANRFSSRVGTIQGKPDVKCNARNVSKLVQLILTDSPGLRLQELPRSFALRFVKTLSQSIGREVCDFQYQCSC